MPKSWTRARHALIAGLLCIFAFSGPARALELAEALALAKQNNRDLKVARERLREAHADVEHALAVLLPRVSALGKYTYNYPEISVTFAASATTTSTVVLTPHNQVDGSLTATVPLLLPSAYPNLQGARLAYQGQQSQLAATEAQLLQTVASAFLVAAAGEGIVRIRSHAIQVTQETLTTARLRFGEGMVTRLEVSRAELAALQAQQRLREAQSSRSAAKRTLGDLLLLRTLFEVVPPAEPAFDQRSEQEVVAAALRQRNEIHALEATIRAAAAQARAIRWRLAPTLSAAGTVRLTNATGFTDQIFYGAAGLQLDWQIFDGLDRDAQGHAVAAQASQARLKLMQLRDSIATSIRNAREQVLVRKEGLAVARQSVHLAEEALSLVRKQQGAGTATQLDVLTAQDQLVTAEVGVEQARLDLSLDSLQLRYLTGSPLLGEN